MTVQLVILMALAGAIGVASFVAALWGTLESLATCRVLKKDPDAASVDIQIAQLMLIRSFARNVLVVVLTTIAVVRLASTDLLVTPSTYVMFSLLLLAQFIVSLFVILDVYERTSYFPLVEKRKKEKEN